MPAVARELTITYGTVQVGGDSENFRLDAGDDGLDLLRITREYERTVVEFGVLLADAGYTDAVFAAFVATLESAFRQPRLRLLIQQGPFPGGPLVPLVDLDPATDTGIEVLSSIEKRGSPHDGAKSRRYSVRIVSGNPADQVETIAGEAGLQSFASTVRFQASRARALDVSGVYTKLAANDAETQYLARIDVRVAAITTALGGVWELTNERRDPNLEGSLIRFSREYEEINLRQTLSAIDDPDIYRQRLTINVGRTGQGDSGSDVLRFTEIGISYEIWLDVNVFLTVQAIRQKWEGVLRPFVIAHAKDAANATALAITDERVGYNKVSNVITVSMRALAATGGNVLSRTITTEDLDRLGPNFVPVWDADPLSAYVFQGPRVYLRTITGVQRVLGTVNPADVGAGDPGGGKSFLGGFGIGSDLEIIISSGGGGGARRGASRGFLGGFGIGQQLTFISDRPGEADGSVDQLGPSPGQLGFVLVEERTSTTNLRLGIPPDTIDVTDLTHVRITRLVKGVALPGGGGDGGGNQGTRVAQEAEIAE